MDPPQAVSLSCRMCSWTADIDEWSPAAVQRNPWAGLGYIDLCELRTRSRPSRYKVADLRKAALNRRCRRTGHRASGC